MRIVKEPEERKREILETAMRLFYEKGYEKTSITDIAKAIGIAQGLCYRYFPSKESLFAVSYTHLDVYKRQAADSVVLLMDYRRIITVCPSACTFHSRLIENMLSVLADKNLLLCRRLSHLSKRTTRDKLLSYLHEQAQLAGSPASVSYTHLPK